MPALLPRWIYFGVGALLLLIVVLNLNRRAGSETHRLPVPVPRVASGPPAQPVFRQPESSVTVPVTTPAATAVPAPAGRPLWRVIAYAYTSSPPAEKKAADINQKRPDLQAQVFHPAGRKSMYLVALGGRMTRSEALKLRRRARAEGLPRDIYIQSFLD